MSDEVRYSISKTYTKQQLIDQYRFVNIEFDDWHQPTTDSYAHILQREGWEVGQHNIYFSGFGSQGDGACFTGSYIGNVITPKWVKLAIEEGDLHIDVATTGSRYQHEKSVVISWECSTEIEDAVLKLVQKLDVRRIKLCRDLYNNLEALYTYYTSDEQVWDWVVDNVLSDYKEI